MSGRKNVLPPYTIFNAADMSQATLTSAVTNIAGLDNISFYASWTGTPTGTIDIQASHDNSTWFNIASTPWASPAGSADDAVASLNQLPWPWVRLKYTKTSSTGSLTASICGKMV